MPIGERSCRSGGFQSGGGRILRSVLSSTEDALEQPESARSLWLAGMRDDSADDRERRILRSAAQPALAAP